MGLKKKAGAFSFIELLVVLALTGFVFGGLSSLMKSNFETLNSSHLFTQLNSKMSEVERKIQFDVGNAIVINSFCEGPPDRNPLELSVIGLPGSNLLDCESLKVHGGLIPEPGQARAALEQNLHFQQPIWPSDTILVQSPSDSLRGIALDRRFSNLGCRLFFDTNLQNPVADQEDLLVSPSDDPNCRGIEDGGILETGRFYVIFQGFQQGSRTLSTTGMFQITHLSGNTNLRMLVETNPGRANPDAQDSDDDGIPDSIELSTVQNLTLVGISSTDSLVNLPGGLAHIGIRTGANPETKGNARFFTAKIFEWTWEASERTAGNLLRREIYKLNNAEVVDASPWELVAENIESIHFRAFTSTAQFGRRVEWSSDAGANGLEDISGVRVQAVLKSNKESVRTSGVANPFMNSETGKFLRVARDFLVPVANVVR